MNRPLTEASLGQQRRRWEDVDLGFGGYQS